MYRLILLFSILVLGTASAEDVPYDVVTYDTVTNFCEEKKTEFENWIKIYQYQVKSGAGVTYPKKGEIYNGNNPDQQLAHMISFYSKTRNEKGYFLITVGEKYLVFQKGVSTGSSR